MECRTYFILSGFYFESYCDPPEVLGVVTYYFQDTVEGSKINIHAHIIILLFTDVLYYCR